MESSTLPSYYPLTVLQALWFRHAPRVDRSIALGEPVVPRSIWVLPVKLPEFLQTSYQKVVI